MAMALNSSALSVAVPAMIQQSTLTMVNAQWVIAIYTLVLSTSLITSGRIADAVGLRKVYLCGLLTVIASSAMLGADCSVRVVLLLRALEGVGAAMISGTSLGLLATAYGPSEYVRSIGWQTGMTYSGLAAGPLLSTVLSAHFSWRAIFVVNVVICSAAFLLACKLLDRSSRDRVRWSELRLIPLFAPMLVLAPIIFILGGRGVRSASSQTSVLVLSGFGFLSAILLLSTKRWRTKLKRMWQTIGPFIGSEFLCYLTTFGTTFVLPVYLIRERHFGPLLAGSMLTCQQLARAGAAFLSIAVSCRFGSLNTRVLGALVIAGAVLSLAAFDQLSWLLIMFHVALIGVGTGLFVTANTAELMAAAQANRRGTITGIFATCRNVGMTVGVLVAGLAYSEVAGPHLPGSGFHAAMFVLGAFAVCNLIYVAKARRAASLSEAAKISCDRLIVPVNVSGSHTQLYSSGETI